MGVTARAIVYDVQPRNKSGSCTVETLLDEPAHFAELLLTNKGLEAVMLYIVYDKPCSEGSYLLVIVVYAPH